MADFLSRLSRAQAELGSEIAAALITALDPHMENGEVMAAFVPCVVEDGDEDAIRALYGADLERGATLSVRGYCDWAAVQIVRSNGYAARPFPIPDAVTTAVIAARCGTLPSVLAFVVARLRERDDLPLLGRLDQGCLIPDQRALEAWKACFEWGSSAP